MNHKWVDSSFLRKFPELETECSICVRKRVLQVLWEQAKKVWWHDHPETLQAPEKNTFKSFTCLKRLRTDVLTLKKKKKSVFNLFFSIMWEEIYVVDSKLVRQTYSEDVLRWWKACVLNLIQLWMWKKSSNCVFPVKNWGIVVEVLKFSQ